MYRKVLAEMIRYFDDDVRRINHALKVFSLAETISSDIETEEETLNIIRYCSILHDIGIREAERKYNSSAWDLQEKEGPVVAEEILHKLGIKGSIIKRVSYIIGNHHSFDRIDGIDFQILVEADLLVNIYEKSAEKPDIEQLRDRYFKTEKGLELITSMYLSE